MENVITIIILTFNEEANLPGLLTSLKGIHANIFVVDSYSTDKTLSILEENNITYVQHPFENYSHQRNWAQDNNPFKSSWVLHLDAGERLTKEFVEWVQKSFDPNDSVDGYIFSRRTMIFGKEIKYGGQYPQYHLRLFKPEKGRCEDKMYDQHFYIKGNTKVIKNRVDIIDTVMENWQTFIVGHARWAVFEAMQQIVSETKLTQEKKGVVVAKFFGSPIEQKRWLKNNIFQKTPLFLRAILFFIYSYFLKFGFLDGKTGLAFHFIQKLWFRFQVDAVILELKTKMKTQHVSLDEIICNEYPENYQVLLFKLKQLNDC